MPSASSPGRARWSPKTSQPPARSSAWFELGLIAATVLALALGIQAFFVKPYRPPSAAMEPTLQSGQRVLVNRMQTRFSDPRLGDIIVFHPPEGSEDNRCGVPPVAGRMCSAPTRGRAASDFIKRVVGLPGQRIAMIDGHVIRDGRRVVENYIRPCTVRRKCTYPKQLRVPKGEYFLLGDNRGAS